MPFGKRRRFFPVWRSVGVDPVSVTDVTAALEGAATRSLWADWRAIEVRRHMTGHCTLTLHREAASLARRRGIGHLSLSLSHDGDRAAAFGAARRSCDGEPKEH
jgi:hypothetical protein